MPLTRKIRLINNTAKYRFRHCQPREYFPTLDELLLLFSRQQNRCAICDIELNNNFCLDHVVPKTWGGLHVLENLQFLCPPCNQAKGPTNGASMFHPSLYHRPSVG
jgi:5-methylcytosine-specific restriction endonuclease McrA